MMAGERLVHEKKLIVPIDPFELARGERIEVIEKPVAGGVSGIFMRVGDMYAIAYAAHLTNEGFQRFSVAHELGHYFLPGHGDHVLSTTGVHESKAGFTSKEPHEIEADQFAVGLLLPTSQVRDLLKKAPEGLAGIEALSRSCKTSLTATAIRFAECTSDPVAILVCNQRAIEFWCMSDSFKAIKGLTWPRQGQSIPKRTASCDFVGDPGRILRGERVEDSTPLSNWFETGPDVRLLEEVVGLGRYGKILTVLTPEECPDEEEREEEDALIESWTPRLSKSRRRS